MIHVADVQRTAAATAEIHRLVDERLRDREHRYTQSRRQIVGALAATAGPVTLPALLLHAPSLAQSSAYRNLAVLEEAGVVRRLVHGADYAHYELAEDLTEHHHHLICERCGLVQDISLGVRIEQSLDAAVADLVRAEGFTPNHHTIDIYGICANCR